MIPQTHAERLLWLAEQEVNCKGYAGGHTVGYGCLECGGTGKVPRFSTLRQECAECGGRGYHYHHLPGGRHPKQECQGCQGRGWVPVDDLLATVPCAHEWRFERWGNRDVLATCRLTRTSLTVAEDGPTYNRAAILALSRAVREAKDGN